MTLYIADLTTPINCSNCPPHQEHTRSPAQVKFPGDVAIFKETLKALISSQLAKPFHSLDKGASIVRADNVWSAAPGDEALKRGNEIACL